MRDTNYILANLGLFSVIVLMLVGLWLVGIIEHTTLIVGTVASTVAIIGQYIIESLKE